MNTIKAHSYSHAVQGVQVKPLTDDGKHVKILYNGLLANSGAGQMFMHYGYGENRQHWERVGDISMSRGPSGWEASVVLDNNHQLNFCFKDAVNNWDNNNGQNWAYRIMC